MQRSEECRDLMSAIALCLSYKDAAEQGILIIQIPSVSHGCPTLSTHLLHLATNQWMKYRIQDAPGILDQDSIYRLKMISLSSVFPDALKNVRAVSQEHTTRSAMVAINASEPAQPLSSPALPVAESSSVPAIQTEKAHQRPVRINQRAITKTASDLIAVMERHISPEDIKNFIREHGDGASSLVLIPLAKLDSFVQAARAMVDSFKR